jgi:type VII secretion-associated protein (TIGR03931 family)
MTEVIVEVGPGTIRGPERDGAAELVSAALESIDDPVALIDDHPVEVMELWRQVLRSVIAESAETVALVCPKWWPSRRIALVRDAARGLATNIVLLQRTRALAEGLSAKALIVVEIGPEFVVASLTGSTVGNAKTSDLVEPRSADPNVLAAKVAQAVGARHRDAQSSGAAAAVLVDTPAGVDGAVPLGAAIADHVRALGVAVAIADQDSVLRAATAMLARQHRQASGIDHADGGRMVRLNRTGVVALAGAVVSTAVLCGGFAVRQDISSAPAADLPMTLLVEGRVALKVPAQWRVQRVTSGPGSARLQIVSPTDPETALHVTQSLVPPHQEPEVAAEAMRMALDEQPAGIFVDFNPADRRADRPAVTYLEVRAGHHIRWVVVLDDTLRIGVGCQSAPGREDLVRSACDQAIGSAHAVF